MPPIIYETYAKPSKARQYAIRFFARVKDIDTTLPITLAKGKAVIVDAWAWDDVKKARVTKVIAFTKIFLNVKVRNDGDTDVIWCTLKDKDTGALLINNAGVKADLSGVQESGVTLTNGFGEFTMPNKDWNILVEAGHGV